MQSTGIDIILTSCGRFDLLERTLDSFFAFNTYPIANFYVFDDSSNPDALNKLSDKYPNIQFLYTTHHIGQIKAIDTLMQHVTTPYYMHLEDDWEFYRRGFIEASLLILEERPEIIQCWLREQGDTNGHPVYKMDGLYSLMSTKYEWKGFSFNPAVRRLSDYVAYGNIATFDKRNPASAEKAIGEYYHSLGKVAAILPVGYVRHIGFNRTVHL